MSLKASMSPLPREKQDDIPRPSVRPLSREPSLGWARLGVIFLAIVSGFGIDSVGLTEWSTIEPSEKLVWQPCFKVYDADFRCARLTVPMDYHRPLNESADNPKVHVALVMKPGLNRTEDPLSYSESPLLLNPGGPGGSGANFALGTGQNIQMILGGDRDIIGFDPRGIGATTPKADCFVAPDDPFGLDGRNVAYMNRLSWLVSGHDVGLINSSNVALSKLNTRAKALGKLCKRVDEAGGDNSIFRYSNTPNVARDMLSIVQAWDEWRSDPDANPAKSMQKPETVDTDTKIDPKDSTRGKLVYWGFSYGTLLGATFASMFPDKVGRVILDGVVDADHYVDRVSKDAILDADAIWETFFAYCAEAGPQCQFSQPGDEPEDVKNRFNDVMNSLEKEPAIVLPRHTNIPIVVTASDVRMNMFVSLYSPIPIFPGIAILLKAIVDDKLDSLIASPAPTLLCHNMTLALWPDDAQPVIGCSDKRYKLNDDLPTLQKRYEDMASYSSFADIWMGIGINLACNGWDIEAKDPPMRWDDHLINKTVPIETSFPILFLSNHLDPVTPLHAALKMTRKFSESGIVEQKAEGHCTVSCISLCTINHVTAYLNKGILPPVPKFDSDDEGEWTTCTCDEKPWKSLHDMAPKADEDLLYGKTAEEANIMMGYSDLRYYFTKFLAHQQQFEYSNPLPAPFLSNAAFMNKKQATCRSNEDY
ncbi:alpha/beta-hydrolase [Hypoxylon crocopeplum]|nr:alpha/beta-hydrolase [Hypoxylon crocopeplum]